MSNTFRHKFLYVDFSAVDVCVNSRQLQTVEYDEGTNFSKKLRNFSELFYGFSLNFVEENGGIYLLKNNEKTNRGIVFDFDTFNGFNYNSEQDSLTLFQKVIRFAIKYWGNMVFSSCEKNIQGTDIAVVFPFAFATHNIYKVFINKKPDKKRSEKRTGNYLLVFASDVGQVDISDTSVTNYRKAITGLIDLKLVSGGISHEVEKETRTLNVTSLDGCHGKISPYLGFENWKTYLTLTQKKFVSSLSLGPERLDGPAGTGKTLCLILRAINLLQDAHDSGKELHLLMITHSASTKNNMIEIFESNSEKHFNHNNRFDSRISICITTLQEWCIEHLGHNISETEYLDKDAQDSKEMQLLYINEALDEIMDADFSSFKKFISPEMTLLFTDVDRGIICEMIQFEIGVQIKGRSQEDLKKYKEINRSKYGLPIVTENDYDFIFHIYRKYQEKLQKINQFDSDDIILSAMGPLNTPIWRRRKASEGYDSILVDETHLFNINELSILHHLNRKRSNNIIFSIDRSQAVGDRGISNEDINESFETKNEEDQAIVNFKTVFRSSPDIVKLAFEVLTSGATLFTQFENPLDMIMTSFTAEDEAKCCFPVYKDIINDKEMADEAFRSAEDMAKKIGVPKSSILICACDEILTSELENYAMLNNKPAEILKRRGDISVVHKAYRSGRFVVGNIDFVGGLEFDGVVIVGGDKGRLPPVSLSGANEGYHFLNYNAHNRLYVAITRARYCLEVLGVKAMGMSRLLESSARQNLIEVR